MKRALVILLGALLLAVAVAGSALVFLALSESGTKFLAGQAERFLPVQISGVSGALLKEIRIDRLTIELENRTLVIEQAATAVQVMPLLFENRLNILWARARAVTLSDPHRPDDQPSPPLELPYVPLVVNLSELDIGSLALEPLQSLTVSGSASLTGRGLRVRRLSIASGQLALAMAGELGTGVNPALTAEVSWSLPDRGWGGHGQLSGRVDGFDLEHSLGGLITAEASGRGNLSRVDTPVVDVAVALSDLHLGDTAVTGIRGQLSGTLANLTASATAQVLTPGVAPFPLAVQAYGPVDGPLTLSNVTAGAFDGREQAQGTLAWDEDLQIVLGGSLEQVALRAFHERLDGRLDGAFQYDYLGGRSRLQLPDLRGVMNGRAVVGALTIEELDDGWAVSDARVRVGRNELTGAARWYGGTVDIDAAFDMPALEALALDVSGDAAGKVRIFGRWPELTGALDLTSTRLAGFDVELGASTLRASADGGRFRAALQSARMRTQDLELEDVGLRGVGTLEHFDWTLTTAVGEGAGELHRRDDAIELLVAEARLRLLEQDWRLQGPARIRLLEQGVTVSPACVAGAGASACIASLSYRDGRIDSRGELREAPVALFKPLLPQDFGTTGYLQGHWNVAGPAAELDGEVELFARQLTYVPGPDQDPVELPDVEANGTLTRGALDFRMDADGEAFSISGRGRLEALAADAPLTGTLQASASDISVLRAFDQRIQSLAGEIDGRLRLSGTPAAVRGDGTVELKDGELRLNDPDLTLSAMNLQAHVADDGSFDARGSARDGGRELTVTASGSGLFDGRLRVDAALTGDRLRVNHPDWEVSLSPNLTFNYAEDKGRLRGRIEVPHAEVRLTTLPTSVPNVSEDVVVVGRDAAAVTSTHPIRVDVEVVLGDDVVLKALGITAELEGSVRARLDAQGRATLQGTLNVTGGVLSAQGQTLNIESGSVVYNGPVGKPYIDLRAVRVIADTTPEVKVGLHIRGDADNLTSSVFAEPAMSETRALSFLVLGRDIDQETAESDSSRLMAAAINLGLSRSKGITSEIMRVTGLDELSASAESEESFAIVAGKRLTDDIYVRYTYNTLSAVGTFLVRYELSRHWELEAQSGERSAMDLMYHIKK